MTLSNSSDQGIAMIEIDSRAFRRAVELAGKAADRRASLPVLETLLCRANGRLEISGTDLNQMLTVSIERGGDQEGSFLFPAHGRISKMLAALGGEQVSLSSAAEAVHVSSGDFRVKVDSKIDPVDFPQIAMTAEGVSEHWSATLSREHLEGLRRIMFAISTEETRYYLNGVFLQPRGDWAYRAWATDGHRLAWFDLQLPDAAGELPANVIISRQTVDLLLRDLAKVDDGMRIGVAGGVQPNRHEGLAPERTAHRIIFNGQMRDMGVTLRSKLIDGTYPDVSRVVPQHIERRAMFEVRDLRRAVQACVAGERNKPPMLKFEFSKGGGCRVSTEWIVLGLHASTPIPCQHNFGDVTIGINGRYMVDVLAAVRGDRLSFNSGDGSPASPVMMIDPSDDQWGVVVMPVRV